MFGKADHLPVFDKIVHAGPDGDNHSAPGDDFGEGKSHRGEGEIIDHQGDDGDDLHDRLKLFLTLSIPGGRRDWVHCKVRSVNGP